MSSYQKIFEMTFSKVDFKKYSQAVRVLRTVLGETQLLGQNPVYSSLPPYPQRGLSRNMFLVHASQPSRISLIPFYTRKKYLKKKRCKRFIKEHLYSWLVVYTIVFFFKFCNIYKLCTRWFEKVPLLLCLHRKCSVISFQISLFRCHLTKNEKVQEITSNLHKNYCTNNNDKHVWQWYFWLQRGSCHLYLRSFGKLLRRKKLKSRTRR